MPKKKTKSRGIGSGTQSGAGTTKFGPADDFSLETQQAPAARGAHPARPGKPKAGATGGKKSGQPEVVSYRHSDKRKNNPDDHKERWCYDPHIDPASILSAVRKNMMNPSPSGRGAEVRASVHQYAHQPDLFAAPFENLPLRDAIDSYKHERGWANRLIAGDSLLVMNSL